MRRKSDRRYVREIIDFYLYKYSYAIKQLDNQHLPLHHYVDPYEPERREIIRCDQFILFFLLSPIEVKQSNI